MIALSGSPVMGPHFLHPEALIKNISAPVYFVRSFDDELFKEMVSMLLLGRVQFGIPLAEIIGRARKLYDIDEGVPDEWVEKVLV